MLAKEMGISTSKLNRIIRLSEATKSVCDAVDDNSLELSIASALSFLKPENQTAVIDLIGLNFKPTVKRVQRLRDAEKAASWMIRQCAIFWKIKTSSRSSSLNRRSQLRRNRHRRSRLHQW